MEPVLRERGHEDEASAPNLPVFPGHADSASPFHDRIHFVLRVRLLGVPGPLREDVHPDAQVPLPEELEIRDASTVPLPEEPGELEGLQGFPPRGPRRGLSRGRARRRGLG